MIFTTQNVSITKCLFSSIIFLFSLRWAAATAEAVLQDGSMIPEYVCTCECLLATVCANIKCVFLSQHVEYMLACACVFSKQWSLCCGKKASAVIDGGDSLEATHQGDAIDRVCPCLCLYGRVSLCVLERKRVMLSYVSLLQPTHWGQSRTRQSFLPRTHTHTIGYLWRSKRHSAVLFRYWILSQAWKIP